MHVLQGTKAEVLSQFGDSLRSARILPIARISARGWLQGHEREHDAARAFVGQNSPVIVRSSCREEDGYATSNAGRFLTVKNVRSWNDLPRAINAVISSYESPTERDEVLLQPMASGIEASGVVMTRDPETGAPYTIIEYSTAGDTDLITSGKGLTGRIVLAKLEAARVSTVLQPLIPAIEELERTTGRIGINVEFGICAGSVLIFQCRPIAFRLGPNLKGISATEFDQRLLRLHPEVSSKLHSAPGGLGGKTLLGVMPDWNPAELIGVRPRPLALSLYRYLISDAVWAHASVVN